MKAVKIVVNVLAALAGILIFALLLISAPQIFGYRPVVVLSGSMEPTYPVGSIAYIKETPFEEINSGDIITFLADAKGTMVTHRVVTKEETQKVFVTQGDANKTPDPNPVRYQSVVGKGMFNIPYAGYAAAYLQKPWMYVVLASVLLLKILLGFLGGRKEEEPEPDNSAAT